MPLVKTDTQNAIRGLAHTTADLRRSCQDVINRLEFADLGRGAGTLYTSGPARLDVQGRTAEGAANLQVQIGTNTAAAALVAVGPQQTADRANQRGVVHGVVAVLNQSLDSGTIWTLTGALP